ncbi:MAG: molybdenum cofactor guanylyltransferase [Acidobacteriota bacterium]
MSGQSPDQPPPEGLILCGGRSRRLGRDKALLPIGGRPIVARVADALAPVAGTVRLLGRPVPGVDLPSIADLEPFAGPLAALGLGLPRCEAPQAFVVSCDMPFLSPGYFELLRDRIGDADVCLPWEGDLRMPLAALYRRDVGERARDFRAQGRNELCAFVSTLRLRAIGSRDLAAFPAGLLKNVNTPEEAREAEILARPA